MDQVSTPEILECMFVNAIAPFVLNSRLKPLMEAPNQNRPDRYIINVSAMEGKFYRYKMPNHPHTNMAKAALNMLTRTSAEDLVRPKKYHSSICEIYMRTRTFHLNHALIHILCYNTHVYRLPNHVYS